MLTGCGTCYGTCYRISYASKKEFLRLYVKTYVKTYRDGHDHPGLLFPNVETTLAGIMNRKIIPADHRKR